MLKADFQAIADTVICVHARSKSCSILDDSICSPNVLSMVCGHWSTCTTSISIVPELHECEHIVECGDGRTCRVMWGIDQVSIVIVNI
jgi:hypothetical protein